MLLNRIIVLFGFCIGSIIKPILIVRCKLNELYIKLVEIKRERQRRHRQQREEQYVKISKYKYVSLFLVSAKVYSRKSKKIQFYKINNVKDYCQRNDQKYIEIEKEKERTVCIPAYWNKTIQRCENYISPETYIAEIEQATIIGESHTVISDGQFLNDALFYDDEERIDLRDNVLRKVMEKYAVVEEPKQIKYLEYAINLVGLASYNYYHMLIEVLPKLLIADRYEEYKSFPILVDEIILQIPQYQRALAIVNQYNHEVIKVKVGEKWEVKRLVYVSPNTWMPINLYEKDMSRVNDFMISESYLYNMRNMILNKVKGDKIDTANKKKRYFISRKKLNTVRLKNESEIRDLFLSYGFEVLYPEKLSFTEQVEKFSEAECIAGSTGAAFANIIFCQPNTKVICIMPQEFQFYMYSTIAYIFKLDQIFLDCMIVERTRYTAADGYVLDKIYTEEFLEQYGKQ